MTWIESPYGNWYGTDHEPAYTTISYKYGSWVMKTDPKLELQGVRWQIPAIDLDYSTVSDFQRYIRKRVSMCG